MGAGAGLRSDELPDTWSSPPPLGGRGCDGSTRRPADLELSRARIAARRRPSGDRRHPAGACQRSLPTPSASGRDTNCFRSVEPERWAHVRRLAERPEEVTAYCVHDDDDVVGVAMMYQRRRSPRRRSNSSRTQRGRGIHALLVATGLADAKAATPGSSPATWSRSRNGTRNLARLRPGQQIPACMFGPRRTEGAGVTSWTPGLARRYPEQVNTTRARADGSGDELEVAVRARRALSDHEPEIIDVVPRRRVGRRSTPGWTSGSLSARRTTATTPGRSESRSARSRSESRSQRLPPTGPACRASSSPGSASVLVNIGYSRDWR